MWANEDRFDPEILGLKLSFFETLFFKQSKLEAVKFVSSSFNLCFLRQSCFLNKAVMLIRHLFLSCHFLGNLYLSYRSFR